MLKAMIGVIQKFKTILNEKGSISLENVGFAITATTLIGAVVVVTGNTLVLDTEEKTHVLNANAMVEAAKLMINENNTGPALDEQLVITLSEMYDADRIGPAYDPSRDNGNLYGENDSEVLIQNVVDDSVPSSNRTINKFFVKLTNTEGAYIYINETNTTVDIGLRTEIRNLSRDNVIIPSRNVDGQ